MSTGKFLLCSCVSALSIAFILTIPSYAVTPDRIAGIDSTSRIALEKSLHPTAQLQYDQGAVEASFKLVYMTLMTSPSAAQQKALERLLAQQQDPNSPNYHKWLTPSQYADRFGLSANDMNRLTAWLKSQGFLIQSIGGGRNTVIFSGTAAQVQNAFQAEIHRYSVEGKEHFANSSPLMIPSALRGIVTGIRGTNDFRMHAAGEVQFRSGPKGRANYYDGTFLFKNFLAPADVATIYDINPLYNATTPIDGTGQTVAIVGRSDILLADINDFRSAFGLAQISSGDCTLNTTGVITACTDPLLKYVTVLPSGKTDPGKPDSVAAGDVAEADLDVEWSGSVAPKAQVVYINAPATDVSDALSYAINPPSGTPIPAPVISMSFGFCEQQGVNIESELQQAATEGITVINSTGDTGAAGCEGAPSTAAPPFSPAQTGLAVGYPASSPWIVAVGGTGLSLANDSYPNPNPTYWSTTNPSNGGTAQKYIPEMAWNDDETFAAYCQAPVMGDTFCSTGGGTAGWVKIVNAQTAQEDLWIFAGGGGASNCFTQTSGICTAGIPQPTWQKTLVVPNLPAAAVGVRWLPDVSLLASPNFPGYIFCTPQNPDATTPVYTSTCVNGISGATGALEQYGSIVGGTSVGAPVFAGMLTLLNQYLAGPSSPGLGDIHSKLYSLAAATPSNHAFNQVTSGDNLVYCKPGTPSTQPASIQCPAGGSFGYLASNADAATGYNLVTGLGSIDMNNLATAWAGTRSTSSTSLGPPSTQATQGASVMLTATVTPSTATGNVSFSNTNGGTTTSLGAAALSSGTATFSTTSLPLGTNSVTATYNGSPTIGNSTSSAVTVTVISAITSFTPTANSFPVTQGSATDATVALTLASGFSGQVTFACQNPGSEISCTAPAGVNASGNVSFHLTTQAPTMALGRPLGRRSGIFYAALIPGLLGIVFVAGSRKRSRTGLRLLGLMLILGASTMWLGSCGGSNNSSSHNPGTPKGNYTINVNATPAGGTPTTASFTLAVQ